MRADKRPRYAEVAETLGADIATGRLAPGDLLPTENQLTQRFEVSRFTVREALRRLAADGLIRRRRGSGTIIVSNQPVLRQSLPDTHAILQYARQSTFRILERGEVRLDAQRARLLGQAEGDHWQWLRGLRVMDGQSWPIALTDAYIHPAFADVAERLESGHEALFHQVERMTGIEVARVDQQISAVAASAAEAMALGLARRAPCLRIVRHYHDRRDRLIEMSCSVHPGERFTYMMAIDGGAAGG